MDYDKVLEGRGWFAQWKYSGSLAREPGYSALQWSLLLFGSILMAYEVYRVFLSLLEVACLILEALYNIYSPIPNFVGSVARSSSPSRGVLLDSSRRLWWFKDFVPELVFVTVGGMSRDYQLSSMCSLWNVGQGCPRSRLSSSESPGWAPYLTSAPELILRISSRYHQVTLRFSQFLIVIFS